MGCYRWLIVCSMKRFAEEILAKIDAEIRLRDCDVDFAMDNALYMVRFIAPMYEQLREMIVSYSFPSAEDEICFFKELKPEILSKYIYFSKVYHIELKCPDGSNDCIREYLSTELDKLTYFFRNNIEFYQYIRSQSTHLDHFYFTRKPIGTSTMPSFESFQYDADPLFSTGYDYKLAKILSNKHLKVYLENRMVKLNNTEYKAVRSNMDVITIESKAYKEIVAKIDVIANYVFSQEDTKNEDEIWVDSYEVCTFLKISEKTLQRLRVSGTIAYSNIRGRYFYKVSEIRRMLEERLVKSNKENIDNLITNHQLYAKERRNLRKDK